MSRIEDRVWKQERRQQPRAEIEMPVEYRILTRSKLYHSAVGRETGGAAARVKNISPEGVLILVWERLIQHSVLSLSLTLPGRPEPVKTLAEVRHLQELFQESSHPYAVGLEFLSISSRDTSTLRWFVFNAKLS